MACYLRALGAAFDVDRFLSRGLFPNATVFRRGEPRNRVSRVINEYSGITVCVSSAGFDEFESQLNDAMRFLAAYTEAIRDLVSFPGVTQTGLDFGTGWLGHAAQFWYFPADFVALLSSLGLSLELSHYPST